MPHLKKDFKYQKKFNNKYVNFTYLCYLYRGKKRHISRRSGDEIPYQVIRFFERLIYYNNKICQRGDMNIHIEEIKEDIKEYCKREFSIYTKDYYDNLDHNYKSNEYDIEFYHYRDWSIANKKKGTLTDLASAYRNSRFKNDLYLYIADLMDKVSYWGDNIDNDFEGFKDFIYDFIEDFRDNHYDWVVGENIIYDRSIRDNATKRVYCIVNNDIGIKKFSDTYLSMISIQEKYKDKLLDQVISFLITLGDFYNLLVKNDFISAKELLNDYCDDNLDINKSIDIYYRKLFEELNTINTQYNDFSNVSIIFEKILKLIENQNHKYSIFFTLYEFTEIDLEKDEYSNIIPLL